MKFNIIDLEIWPRKTHYDFYTRDGGCTFNLTKNIDLTNVITHIKMNNYKFYPTFTYIVTKAINKITEFKVRINELGQLGYWDYLSPTYSIFHEDDKTFSCIYTEYTEDFLAFYRQMVADMATFKNIKGICPKPSPKNCFHISCLPWLSYTGFSIEINSGYFAPIITWGKYIKNGDLIEIPLSLQANHAIIDGYHASKLINLIQELCFNFKL